MSNTKTVRVMSRKLFEDYCEEQNWTNVEKFDELSDRTLIIEIIDTQSDSINNTPVFKGQSSKLLVQYFDDVDNKVTNCTPFNEDQALEIVNFVTRHTHFDKFIVHCSAGISRSGAVGLFIYDWLKLVSKDAIRFPDRNQIRPNARVSRLINQIAFY